MATSVLAASHDHNTNLALSEDLRHHHPNPLQTKTEAMRNDQCRTARQNSITSRRKLTRGNDGKKKERQRGMGVEQLERLRLGEGWKNMAEISHNGTPSSLTYATVLPASFAHDPTSLNTVPLPLTKYGPFATSNSTVTGVGGLNLNQPEPAAFWVPRVGLFHGPGLFPDENFQGNHYGVGNGSETSKELSSTPNMINSYSDRCSVCHQKKRNFVAQNLMMYKGVKDMNMEMPSPAPSSDLIGLNVVNSQNNKGRPALAYGKNIASFHAGSPYSVSNIDQGITDVVAVHRKGSSSGDGNGSFFMEYEFFPVSEKGSRIDSENELTMVKKNGLGASESSSSVAAEMMGSGGGGGDTSCITTTTTCGGVGLIDASSSIDLSLKLSY